MDWPVTDYGALWRNAALRSVSSLAKRSGPRGAFRAWLSDPVQEERCDAQERKETEGICGKRDQDS